MTGQRQAIDNALRQDRRARLLADVQKGGWLIGSLIALLLAFAYWSASPRESIGIVAGVAVGAHQPASETGRMPIQMRIALEGGGMVTVTLPRGELYRSGARVEVEVIRRTWPPHSLTYKFVRYSERQ